MASLLYEEGGFFYVREEEGPNRSMLGKNGWRIRAWMHRVK